MNYSSQLTNARTMSFSQPNSQIKNFTNITKRGWGEFFGHQNVLKVCGTSNPPRRGIRGIYTIVTYICWTYIDQLDRKSVKLMRQSQPQNLTTTLTYHHNNEKASQIRRTIRMHPQGSLGATSHIYRSTKSTFDVCQ